MKHIKTGWKRGEFQLLATTVQAQAAMMTLPPGGTSDDEPSNEHPANEQWLFVIAGRGVARIGKARKSLRRVELAANSLLIIERRELHQIENTGRKPMVTLNFYVPQAYDRRGNPR